MGDEPYYPVNDEKNGAFMPDIKKWQKKKKR